MSKLKPCPFCGSEAYHSKENNKYTPYINTVECSNGECETNDFKYISKQEAIDAWNNRPLESEMLEALKVLSRNMKTCMVGYAKEANKNNVANADIRESSLFEYFNEAMEQSKQVIAKAEGK